MNKKSALDVKHLPTARPLQGKKFLTSPRSVSASESRELKLFIKIFQLFYELAQ